MSRAALFTLLSGDAQLMADGINIPTVYQTNTADNPETKPFLVIRWEIKTVTFETRGPQNLSIWAHDERGDYARIDRILDRVIELLGNVQHLAGSDGGIITSASFTSMSDDLWDDGYRTITKYASFRVVTRTS